MNIAIFASGSGTNAEKIIHHFTNHGAVNVALIVSTKAEAFVVQRAKNHEIPYIIIEKESFYNTKMLLSHLNEYEIGFIVLAGFLWMVPAYMIEAFPKRMVNLHPALLPKYGGKGMYGMNVHRAVLDAGEMESGISIHYVNEKYDDGQIIAQFKCEIEMGDTPELLAEKIRRLEHIHYPEVIENILSQKYE